MEVGMKLVTGELDFSGVSSGRYISSDAIDVSRVWQGIFNLHTVITGDFGATGSGVSVTWSGCHKSSGTSEFISPIGALFVRVSGTSVNGPKSNGVDAASFTPDLFPFLKVKGRHSGSATTSTGKVVWTLIAI